MGSCSAVLSHSGDFEPFWAILVLFWAILGPRGYPNGPRVVQYNIYSCNIPMGSVLRSVGAFQGNIWSVAPFIPVGPSKNGLKKHEKSDFSKNARPIFLVFSHNPSILGMKEIPKFSRSVTYTLG